GHGTTELDIQFDLILVGELKCSQFGVVTGLLRGIDRNLITVDDKCPGRVPEPGAELKRLIIRTGIHAVGDHIVRGHLLAGLEITACRINLCLGDIKCCCRLHDTDECQQENDPSANLSLRFHKRLLTRRAVLYFHRTYWYDSPLISGRPLLWTLRS